MHFQINLRKDLKKTLSMLIWAQKWPISPMVEFSLKIQNRHFHNL